MQKHKVELSDNTTVVSKTIKDFFHLIDLNLQQYHLRIKKGVDEIDGEMSYVLINTADNIISQLENSMDSHRHEYFFRIINYLVKSEGKSIKNKLYVLASSPSTINSLPSQKSLLNFLEAQLTLENFINEQWLKEDKEGNIVLSQRSILELEPYIMSIGKEIEKDGGISFHLICFLCKKICTIGQKCDYCSARIHLICLKKYKSKQNQGEKQYFCPSCKK